MVVASDFTIPLGDEELAKERGNLKALVARPEGELFPTVGATKEVEQDGHPVYAATFAQAKEGRLRKETAGFLTAQRMVIVSTVFWKDWPGLAASAERAALSVEPH
jgi:hypothetical protein